jgi:hypothetical protein
MYRSFNTPLVELKQAARLLTILFLPAIVLAAGCASLPTDYPKTESTALEDYQSTALGKRWAALWPQRVQHPHRHGRPG